VSARVLFRSFRQHRGCTPMEFAKQARLHQARGMLAEPEASVTAVAYACGFFTTGHFARAYREAFGELPSQTIQRSTRSRRRLYIRSDATRTVHCPTDSNRLSNIARPCSSSR